MNPPADGPPAPPPPPPPPPSRPASAPVQEGRWVWVATDARPGEPSGTWMWSPSGAGAAAPTTPRNSVGRAGLFVGGYFGLGLVNSVFGTIAAAVVGDDLDAGAGPAALVLAAVAAAFTAGLVHLADRWRGELDPLGIVAMAGSSFYVGTTLWALGAGVGFSGDARFWLVVLGTLPYAVGTLLARPHPVLGVSVALLCLAATLAAPAPFERFAANVATKSFVLALVLVGLALVVDVRSGTRAGSLLHYGAVVALAVAKFAFASWIGLGIALPLVLGLAAAELVVGLVDRRRSWAYSAWITLQLGLATAVGVVLGLVGQDADVVWLPAPVVIVVAVLLQRREEELRSRLLAVLPASVADRLPA